ncbi:hypothetical protein CH275_26330 [Rhodococcus sp. 06-235-1A]|uniref:DUF2716 domain-containing protein n=1 Tax=Rhodococcus sp. 06-235-1A TaxID=2022508 RepID=UPI000B9BB48A|nr:DUF2716 domain-containing protein [Rhodococcus sp. 06-235-1A]OZC97753.1 hypothetical protein CH275_26330 [Rhodococcus sp. 06-235-1A]
MTTKLTMDFGAALPIGWTELDRTAETERWSEFTSKFGFRPGTEPESWPAIAEPAPSMTFDLDAHAVRTTASWSARADAINAEALRCFVTEFSADPTFVVLDWQHPCYSFDAEAHAEAAENAEWRVPVHPNGDYYIFARDGFTEGTFGHPWERTLCVFGPRMVATLGRTLATWLPTIRVDGKQVSSRRM